MPIKTTEIETIEALTDYLDNRYVKKDDCEKKHDKVEKEISDGKTAQAIINTKLNIVIAILAAIGTCLLPIIIKMLIGG